MLVKLINSRVIFAIDHKENDGGVFIYQNALRVSSKKAEKR